MSTTHPRRQTRRDTNISPLDDHPDLNLTVEEKRYYSQLYKQVSDADTGIISGDKGYRFFIQSKLSEDQLGYIWGLVDGENRGFLTSKEFIQCLRLIGRVQAQPGRAPELSMAIQRKCVTPIYS